MFLAFVIWRYTAFAIMAPPRATLAARAGLRVLSMPLPAPDSTALPDLKDRVVFVTGAAGGLGHAITIACATAGATVVLHGRVVRKLEALYDEVMALGAPEPVILPLDFAKAEAEDFANVASALESQFGRLDAIVHTAVQLGTLGPLEHQSFDLWLSGLRINLAAPMGLTRALARLLAQSTDASVTFTLDTRGQEPHAYWGSYAAAKAGLSALTTIMADEWENAREPARQRRRSRPDPFAAAHANSPGRGARSASAARSARAAVPASDLRTDEGGERRAYRCSGLARRRAGRHLPSSVAKQHAQAPEVVEVQHVGHQRDGLRPARAIRTPDDRCEQRMHERRLSARGRQSACHRGVAPRSPHRSTAGSRRRRGATSACRADECDGAPTRPARRRQQHRRRLASEGSEPRRTLQPPAAAIATVATREGRGDTRSWTGRRMRH